MYTQFYLTSYYFIIIRACMNIYSHLKRGFSFCSPSLECKEDFLHEAGCVSACPGGFYEDEGVCARCHSDCELCHGSGPNDCDSCADPDRTLHSGTCVSACPSQTYRDSRSGECMGEYKHTQEETVTGMFILKIIHL